MVQTIIFLARSLGMSVVAEGIETEAQLTCLRTMQCEFGQGFFFDKPMSADAVGALLDRKVVEADGSRRASLTQC